MANTRRTQATVAAQAQAQEVATVATVATTPFDVVEQQVAKPTVQNQENSIFSQFADAEDIMSPKDIEKQIIASGFGKKILDLRIKNVVVTATQYIEDGKVKYDNNNAFITLVCDKAVIIGDTRTGEDDAFGNPIIGLGKTKNIITSLYALTAVMKNEAKTAVFVPKVLENPHILETLFANSTVDILMQYVPANTDYVNPFSSSASPVSWDRDRMLHHVTRINLGSVGEDIYRAMLTAFMQ